MGAHVNDLPFRTLLYRYFFFGWLFKEAGGDNMFERAVVERHNREQARWLPLYILRWLWLGLALYALGEIAELVLKAPVLSMLFYVVSAISLGFTITIGTAWLGIRGAHRLQ